MKKISILVVATLLLTGCSEKMMTCTSTTTTTSGLKNTTTYDVEYKNDQVKYVKITYHYNQDNTNGVGTGTDGTTNDTDIKQDGIVDGVVGEIIDEATETVLDIAGVRTNYQNLMTTYNTMNGFTSMVDIDLDNEYKVTYKIDLTKMTDANLATFNIDRDYTTFRNSLVSNGLTCK